MQKAQQKGVTIQSLIIIMESKESKLKLGYWAIRGKGQVPRLLLAYSGVEWEDVLYEDDVVWFQQDKYNLGLEFPNLPYFIDHEFKLTESDAICRYIAEKYGHPELLGKTLEEKAKVNMLLGVLYDVRGSIGSFMLDKQGYKEKMLKVYDQIKLKLEILQKYTQDKQEFMMGQLTLADFIVAQTSYYINSLYPQNYQQYPFLQRIRQKFNNLPAIKNYYNRPDAIKRPFVTPSLAAIQVKCDDL